MQLYRQLDLAFLNRTSMSHERLKEELENLAATMRVSDCADKLYEVESKKAILEKLLIDAVDREMALDYCLSLMKEIDAIGFDSILDRATIAGEIIRYAARRNERVLVSTLVASLKSDIDEYIEELSAFTKSLRDVWSIDLDPKNNAIDTSDDGPPER